MGLLRRRRRPPVVHPPGIWRIHVPADPGAVRSRLDAHRRITPGAAGTVAVASAGGWSTVVVTGPHHPWAVHNLTLWLVDGPGGGDLILVAERCGDRPGYWLSDDPEPDVLSGADETGAVGVVRVPDHAVVRERPGDRRPPLPGEALAARGVPLTLRSATTGEPAGAALEDPGGDLNPTLATTHRRRSDLGADPWAW